MPALFIMLVIVIIRSVTLPGAAEGLKFMFKPDWSAFAGTGWITVLSVAGGQMFSRFLWECPYDRLRFLSA